MKAKEVLQTLRISRPTLCRYVKEGTIKVTTLPNGLYDYDEESVYTFLNKGVPRSTYIYARVSTRKQKASLERQIENLERFCCASGYKVSKVFSDIANGVDFEKRKQFFNMLDDIMQGKVERVVIAYKDRLSRIGFGLFKHLFAKYGCEIVVQNDTESETTDDEEIVEDIIAMLHCYAMKFYSKRKVNVVKKALVED